MSDTEKSVTLSGDLIAEWQRELDELSAQISPIQLKMAILTRRIAAARLLLKLNETGVP